MQIRRTRRLVVGTALALGSLFALLPAAHAADAATKVRFVTSAGDIVVELDGTKAPKTVANFVRYVKANHYNGTVFHRVINGFMIQGGGMTADMDEKPTDAPIELESRNGLTNKRGTLAMARTNFPHSATAQFFINLKDNAFLDAANSPDGNGYAVFGKVVSGMEVVDKIATVRTGVKNGHRDVPVEPIVIKKATLEN